MLYNLEKGILRMFENRVGLSLWKWLSILKGRGKSHFNGGELEKKSKWIKKSLKEKGKKEAERWKDKILKMGNGDSEVPRHQWF